MYNTCECPYCGYENTIDTYEGDSFDWECSECGKEFEIEIEYDPIFNANKIEYVKCDECGREERSSDIRYEGMTNPYPEKYRGKGTKLCHDCYVKGVFEDMEKEVIDDIHKDLYKSDIFIKNMVNGYLNE